MIFDPTASTKLKQKLIKNKNRYANNTVLKVLTTLWRVQVKDENLAYLHLPFSIIITNVQYLKRNSLLTHTHTRIE